MGRAWWVRPALLVLLVLAGTVVLVATGVPSIETIRMWTTSAGWAAPVAFALLYAALTLVPAPATVLTIAAGVLFGLPLGLATTLCGATLGAMMAFGLGRGLGRSAVARIPSDRLAWLDDKLRRRGVVAVIGIRLVPVIPFSALNYACGLTGIRTRDYALGTAVGILPSAVAYTTIGAYGADPGSVPFLLAVGGVAALVIGGAVVSRRRRTRVRPAAARSTAAPRLTAARTAEAVRSDASVADPTAAAARPIGVALPADAFGDTRPLDVVRP